jgi:hypothetical protein
MSDPKWTFGKFITKYVDSGPVRYVNEGPIAVGGESLVDMTTGDWTIGQFVFPPLSGGIVETRNQLPLPPLVYEPDLDENPPEPEAGPQR